MAVNVTTISGVDPTGVSDSSVALNAAIASGGAFYFPEGTYSCNSLVYNGSAPLTFIGDGPGTIFNLNSAAANLLTVNGGNFTGHDFTVQYATQGGATSASTFFVFQNGQHTLHDVSFLYGNNLAIWSQGCTRGGAYDISALAPTGNGFEVDVSWSTNGQQYGILMFSRLNFQATTQNTGTALLLISGDTVLVDQANLAGFQNGIQALTSASRSYLANLRFSDVFVDGAGGPVNSNSAWYFDGTNQLLARITLANCWAGTMGSLGMYFKNTKSVDMVAQTIIQNGTHGLVIDTGVNDFAMTGGKVTGNSRTASGRSICHGIVVLAGYNITFDGVRSGPTFNTTTAGGQADTQGYGMIVNSNAVTEYSIINCDLRGNLTASLQDLGGGTQGMTKNVSGNFVGTYP
jgi:hypothetical protein